MRIKEPTVKRQLQATVASGCAWLDVVAPGWHRNIDLRLLDLSDMCLCVIGQLVGEYLTDAVGVVDEDESSDEAGAARLGFTDVKKIWDYDELTKEWARVIRKRQRAEAVPA
jgi:hypothetical protein